MKLTDNFLKAQKPREKAYTSPDGGGLYVEVLPTGGKVWRYRYRINGKQDKVTIGPYPEIGIRAARDIHRQMASDVAMGKSPAREKQAKKKEAVPQTFAEFAERYYLEIQSKDRKDCTIPRRQLDNDINPAIGKKLVSDVTAEDVRRIVFSKKDHGFDAAAAALRGLLKRIFDYAMTHGLVGVNPAMSIPMKHIYKAKPRDRALTQDEIKTFLTAVAHSNMRRQFKVALHIYLKTLVRKSVLLMATWDQIDLERGEWVIPAGNEKMGKPHVVYLSPQVIEHFKELKRLASGSELVLPGRASLTQPFSHDAIGRALQKSMQYVVIEHFTIHDLRRTASTLLHENGWNSDVVEKALSHTMGGVRGVYNKAEYAAPRREMLRFWADHIDALIGADNVVMGSFARVA